MSSPPSALFASARWYDLGVNWDARLARELPVLSDIFGAPGEFGLLDAACGTGRHIAALVKAGYRVAGLDSSADMLAAARSHLAKSVLDAVLIQASLDAIPSGCGPFDGVYCIGNSLAALGDAAAAERAVASMASVLRPGGRLLVQIVNFAKMRTERPCIRGPRARREGGVEYISTRVFSFHAETVEITSLTLWRPEPRPREGEAPAEPRLAGRLALPLTPRPLDHAVPTSESAGRAAGLRSAGDTSASPSLPLHDEGWRHFAASSVLYPISERQMVAWSAAAGLAPDALYGGYDRRPFDPAASEDLILVATRRG